MRQTTLVLAVAPAIMAANATPTCAKTDGMAEVASTGVSSAMLIRQADDAPNWAALVANDDGELPRFRPVPNGALLEGPSGDLVRAEWMEPYAQVMRQAYAHAVLGHIEYARYMVAQAEAGLQTARGATGSAASPAEHLIAQVERQTVRPIAGHVAARIAFAEGRTDEARALAARSTLDGPTGVELAAEIGLPLQVAPMNRHRFAHAVTLEDKPLAVELAALIPVRLALPALPTLSDETDVAAARPALAVSSLHRSQGLPAYPAIRQPYFGVSWTPGYGYHSQIPSQLAGILPLQPTATASMIRLPFD